MYQKSAFGTQQSGLYRGGVLTSGVAFTSGSTVYVRVTCIYMPIIVYRKKRMLEYSLTCPSESDWSWRWANCSLSDQTWDQKISGKKKEDKCHDSYERIMSGQLLGNHMISTMYMESLSLQHSLPAEGKVITKLLEQPVV